MFSHAYPQVEDDSTKVDMTHLSGMTMADFIKEPQIHLVSASPSISKDSSVLHSKRTSVASTTKSQLRHSNHLLIEMLQNIQTELSTHRTIMLDIQHRVSHLEHESNASVNGDSPRAALQALEGTREAAKRNSKLIPPEGQTWWQACQNFARNSEPPISAAEFLRTPKRFSGLDWQFGVPSPRPNTPPATPPDVDDLPPLTPTSVGSVESEQSYIDTPTRHDIFLGEEIHASTPRMEEAEVEDEDEIKEHTVEIDKGKMPAPPMLQPAPGGKPVVVKNEQTILAMETEFMSQFTSHPQRYYKGIKSLATYKACLRNKGTEKGKCWNEA